MCVPFQMYVLYVFLSCYFEQGETPHILNCENNQIIDQNGR